jgi:hypothetical protein
VEGWSVAEGGPGERWARGLGFRPVRATVLQHLDAADPARRAVEPPRGHRSVFWAEAVPAELTAASALPAAALRADGVGHWVAADDQVVGFTELRFLARRNDIAQQADTAVPAGGSGSNP